MRARCTGRRWRWARWCGGAAVGTLLVAGLVAGCSAPGRSLESAPEVALTAVGAVLHAPVWSYNRNTLIALTDDQRLAEVTDPADAHGGGLRLSDPLAAGRNLQISRKDEGQVFVPQPERGNVAVVDLATLRPIDSIDAGPAPAYLSEDAGMRVLLALSADGATVTPVEEYGYRKLPAATLGTRAETIDGSNRGRTIDYHAYSASGIGYYKGPSSPPEQRGSIGMGVAVSAGDGTKVTRSYVAQRDSDVLYAVDSHRGGSGLEVLAQTRLSSPVRELGTDATRIYAATDRQLVVLETASFTGYPQQTIPIIHVTDYRASLPDGPLQSAPLSGLAVGPHRVYLTLRDAKYVISIAKPRL
ncbi:hypothetical protein A5634_07945 [Mycobacterium asiaticum]|uniref:Phytase-like domain-containing protein n=1 Tax=Mycobacterium asiaticum TaxID=1790 RepID=A0A1A3NIW3_MYCAS|nr:hypothetical protein [Mycobacterium asiaticum]OBK22098.1 hypothetical protein A5634_07945 [Mycobacterium asiaticum]